MRATLNRFNLLVLLMFFCNSGGFAQAGIVFASEPGTTCVMQDDYLWMEVDSPVVHPYKDWLAQGRTGGFLVSPTITSQKGTATFPQMKEVGISNYTDNQRVNLPLIMTPISRLDLSPDPESQVTKIDVDVKYIEQKQATKWGAGLQTFAQLVEKLPIPPGPYSAAAQQVSTFTDKLVSNSLTTEGLDSLPAKFSLSVNVEVGATANQRCPRFLEMGTYAIVDPSPDPNGAETGDYIDIHRTPDYCVYSEQLGGGVIDLKWQKRESLTGGICTGTGALHPLANNYVPLVVWSAPKQDAQHHQAGLPLGLRLQNHALVETPTTQLQPRTGKALQVCERHHISRADCFANPWEGPATPEIRQKLNEYKHNFDLRLQNQSNR